MKFNTAISRQKRSKTDVEQRIKSPAGPSLPKLANSNLDHGGLANGADDQENSTQDDTSRCSSPTGSTRHRKHLEADGSNQESPQNSPKHSISTIMSSMKKANAWSEITTTAIKVPTVARIVWLANRGRWLALDQLLDKLFLEEAPKVDLNIEASLLGVCREFLSGVIIVVLGRDREKYCGHFYDYILREMGNVF